jgi:hypothetical protein
VETKKKCHGISLSCCDDTNPCGVFDILEVIDQEIACGVMNADVGGLAGKVCYRGSPFFDRVGRRGGGVDCG